MTHRFLLALLAGSALSPIAEAASVPPSGGADDTAEIAAALGTYGSVQLQKGTYRVCGLGLPSGSVLEGPASAVVFPTTTCATPVVKLASNTTYRVTLRGFTINGSGNTSGAALISLDNAGGGGGSHRLLDLTLQNGSGDAVYLGWKTNGTHVRGNYISHNAGRGIVAAGADSLFSDNDIGDNDLGGAVLSGSSQEWSGNKIWGSGGWADNPAFPPANYPAYAISNSGYHISGWTQDNGGPAILLAGGTSNVVADLRSDSDACGAAVVQGSGTNIVTTINASHRSGGACTATGSGATFSTGPIQ